MMQDTKTLFDAYARERDNYERLARTVANIIEIQCQENGLRPIISWRAKDIRSLIKKCILHKGPVDRVRDRAGVKVVARYDEEINLISDLVKQKFEIVSGPDIKKLSYKPEELGYLGVHYHVKLLPCDTIEEFPDRECEVILHTGAETLWDSISHELLYKPVVELPTLSQRALLRLLALVEIFDKEVASVRQEYVGSPGYESLKILDILEKYFYRVDPRSYRRDLSIKTIEILSPALGNIGGFDSFIGDFFNKHQDALKNAYKLYTDPDDYRGIFLHQPESLLIFALFSRHKQDQVKRLWVEAYTRESLEELGAIWGITISPH